MYSLRTSTLILSIPKRSPSDSCSTNDEAMYLQPQLQATKKCQDLWYKAEKQEEWECMEEECIAREGCEQKANEQHEGKK